MRVGLAAEVSCVSCSSENRLVCLTAVAHTYRTSVFLNPTVEGGGVHTLTPDGS